MLLAFLSSLVSKYQCYVKYKRAVYELQSLSDRQLSDMGIARCDIYKVAQGDCHA